MRGGREEDGKVISPMFPRLHVNDADKGGPRAPPRNKMALYEQLSVPSKRFKPASVPTFPMPPLKVDVTLPSALPSQNLRLVKDQESPLLRPVITDLNLNKFENNCLEKKSKEGVSIKEQNGKLTSHVRSEERSLETFNIRKESYNQESAKIALGNEKISHNNGKMLQQGHYCDANLGNFGCSTDTEIGENQDTLSLGGILETKAPNGSSPATEKRRETVDNLSESVDIDSAQRNCEVSETSTVDSDSGLNLSPDEVVGVIGPKHFWKARRAIVNQQRIFAVQVFELHRLIKVQKLIAASPALLLEDNPFLHGSLRICLKNDSSKQNEKASSQNLRRKVDLQKTDNSVLEKDNMLPLPSQDVNLNKEPVGQVSQDGPSPGMPTSVPIVSDNRPNPLCFQPANNQWLIPVMSPSEGLVYKPYMGPSPPMTGFMAPVYYGGGYSPLAMPPIPGGFTTAAYGIPASYPKNFSTIHAHPTVTSPHYLQVPLGHPVKNTTSPSLPHDRAKPSEGTLLNNIRNKACSDSSHKIHPSKENESHLNLASSANIRPQGLHFTPVSFSDQALNSSNPSVVIKVVPHNASCATESAARIFRSIQKERKND